MILIIQARTFCLSEQYGLLGCNAAKFRDHPVFLGHIHLLSPQTVGQARNTQGLLPVSPAFLFGFLFNSENVDNVLLKC
jgi:hypothetical protein